MGMDLPGGFLGNLGYILDTPGAYTRGVLGGQGGDRISGRQMLQNWGAVGENQAGLDIGDALRAKGYDAITHTGGRYQGNSRLLHDVNISLYPDRVFGPWVAPPHAIHRRVTAGKGDPGGVRPPAGRRQVR